MNVRNVSIVRVRGNVVSTEIERQIDIEFRALIACVTSVLTELTEAGGGAFSAGGEFGASQRCTEPGSNGHQRFASATWTETQIVSA
jgi:hypothetical protein